MDLVLGFTSCLADPDIWMRKAVSDKGVEYYKYVLLYVDDSIVVSERPREILEKLD